jgi:hypothetical protein
MISFGSAFLELVFGHVPGLPGPGAEIFTDDFAVSCGSAVTRAGADGDRAFVTHKPPWPPGAERVPEFLSEARAQGARTVLDVSLEADRSADPATAAAARLTSHANLPAQATQAQAPETAPDEIGSAP